MQPVNNSIDYEKIHNLIAQYGTIEDLQDFEKQNRRFASPPSEIKKINKNTLISQSNNLIESGWNLNSVEARIIFALLSFIDPFKDTKFTKTQVYIEDLAKACGFNPKKALFQINQACDSIMKKPIISRTIKNNEVIILRYPWFCSLHTNLTKKTLIFQFHEDIKSELLKLHLYSKGYTTIGNKALMQLKDVFPMRLFQLIIKNLKRNQCQYSIEDIVFMFQLEDSYIDKRRGKINTSLLIKKNIEPAIEKINKLTNIHIEFSLIKENKTIKYIQFFMYPNRAIPAKYLMREKNNIFLLKEDKIISAKIKELENFGLESYYINSIINKFQTPEIIAKAIDNGLCLINKTETLTRNATLFCLIMQFKNIV